MFEGCADCGGSGYRSFVGATHHGPFEEREPCPSCVGGRVVSESVIEKAANAIYALDWGNHPPQLNAVTWNKALERARAVGRVVLEHMKDSEKENA